MIHVRETAQRPAHVNFYIYSGEPGTALALLVKCLQNLCAGDPAARKQVQRTNQFVVELTEQLRTDA